MKPARRAQSVSRRQIPHADGSATQLDDNGRAVAIIHRTPDGDVYRGSLGKSPEEIAAEKSAYALSAAFHEEVARLGDAVQAAGREGRAYVESIVRKTYAQHEGPRAGYGALELVTCIVEKALGAEREPEALSDEVVVEIDSLADEYRQRACAGERLARTHVVAWSRDELHDALRLLSAERASESVRSGEASSRTAARRMQALVVRSDADREAESKTGAAPEPSEDAHRARVTRRDVVRLVMEAEIIGSDDKVMKQRAVEQALSRARRGEFPGDPARANLFRELEAARNDEGFDLTRTTAAIEVCRKLQTDSMVQESKLSESVKRDEARRRESLE